MAPHGSSSFIGPVLKGAGATSGLSFGQVTAYDAVPAIQYDVRIVAPNAADCSKALAGLPDFTKLPALPAGGYVTVAAVGDVSPTGAAANDPAFRLAAFIDEHALTDATKGALRFVHASPGTPAVDVGLGKGSSFTAVFADVSFGNVAAKSSAIDANGYYVGAPFTAQTVTARPAGTTTDALSVPNVSLPAGAIATAFAIGGKTGDSANPLRVLLCVDNAAPAGLLSSCQ